MVKKLAETCLFIRRKQILFCFCCKLFNNSTSRPKLANDGNNDWRHLSTLLKQHEMSPDPITHAAKWMETK